MLELICLAIATGILILAICFAFKNRTDMGSWSFCVLLGILFSTFFMVLPTEWVSEGTIVEHPLLYTIVSSLFYSFKALGGGPDIIQLETIALSGVLKTVYLCINYLMSAVAPVLASSLIISFIGDTGEKIRYYLSFSDKCYVFSEINENSITLAKGIKKTNIKSILVFCESKSADKDLLNEARKIGGITLYKSTKSLKLLGRIKEYEFCFVSDNEDCNIELTEDIIIRREKLENHKITVNTFAQSGTNINVMESMVSKKPCAVFESTHELLINSAKSIINYSPDTRIIFFNANESDTELRVLKEIHPIETYNCDWKTAVLDDSFGLYDINLHFIKEKTDEAGKKTFKVSKQGLGYLKNHLVETWQDDPMKIRFVDEIALFCNHLLFKHPLYDLPSDRKDISVLLVGCGRLCSQMLKTVMWCGQIDGYTLKIRVLDKKATDIEKEFYSNCPEANNYDIKFENVDVQSIDFESKIKEYSDATFICVATGSDELNISTAESIYRIFRRNYSGYTPHIYTRVRKIIKTNNFVENSSFLAERNIDFFGTTSSIFSSDTLFNSELENIAFAVHLCYYWALEASKDSFVYKKALYDFYTSEYSRRSSMAAALHIPSKLRSLGIKTIGTLPTDEDLSRFEELIKNDDVKLSLMKCEHERWNAFMRSEGFRTVDFDTVKKYAPLTGSHKDEVAKLHPCIVSWEALDDLQQEYDKLQRELDLKPSNFKEYDEKIVVEIPQIIRKARELSKEGW